MDIPREAIEIAKLYEGLSLKPYLCPGGEWTIGYGHRCEATHPTITEAQAESYLINDMENAAEATDRLAPNLTGSKRAAIIDFVFNLGEGAFGRSTLRKRLLDEDWAAAEVELRRWVYAKGVRLEGLVKRRNAEVKLLRK